MQHRRARGGAEGRAHRLEVVGRGVQPGEAAQQRDRAARRMARDIAKQRPEGIVRAFGGVHVQHQRGAAGLVQIDAGQGRAPRHGHAEVEVIGVLRRPRAQDGVGEDDRVGFGPGDVLARCRAVGQQVGRAGEAGAAPHADIGIGKARGAAAEIGIDALPRPALAVHRDGVDGRGHPDLRAKLGHPLGEDQVRRMGENGAVHVAARNVGEALGPLLAGHRADDPHGKRRRFSVAAIENCAVLGRQGQGRVGGVPDGDRDAIARDRIRPDPQARLGGQAGEVLRADAQHRDRAAEHLGPDQGAEGQDVLGFGKHQRRRGAGVQHQVQHHARARAGPPAGRHHHHRARQPRAMGRVMGVDHPRRFGIDAAPEAEALGHRKDRAFRQPRQDAPGGHFTTKPWAKGSRSSMKIVL